MDKFETQYRPNYDPAAVQHMRDELTDVGFQEMFSEDDVDRELLNRSDESVLLVVNSVCGCAAGSARRRHRLLQRVPAGFRVDQGREPRCLCHRQ